MLLLYIIQNQYPLFSFLFSNRGGVKSLLLVKRAIVGTLRGGSAGCSQYQAVWCCNPCCYL